MANDRTILSEILSCNEVVKYRIKPITLSKETADKLKKIEGHGVSVEKIVEHAIEKLVPLDRIIREIEAKKGPEDERKESGSEAFGEEKGAV